MKIKIITLFLLLTLLLVPSNNAYAQSPGGDVIRIGENFTLKSDEVLNGSLVVIGGNATIEEGAKVSGDIVVIGGNLMLDGNTSGNVVIIGGNATSSARASGDMVAIGGQILLTKTAVVTGNVVTLGGQVTQEDGAEIAGDIINNVPPMNIPVAPGVPDAPNIPDVPYAPYGNFNANPFWDVAGAFGKALMIAAIAMLLALFLQPQMERVSDTIMKQTFLSGSFGLLAVVLAPLAIVIMALTIILIPVAAIVAFIIMPCVWVFGMVALGQEIGERFTKAINQIWSPVLSTGLGTFMLVFVIGAASALPYVECIGSLLSALVSLVVMGGVIKTWFDSRGAPGKPAAPVAVLEVPPAS